MKLYTDKYFTKTRNCVEKDTTATYGVFLRQRSICAVELALKFLHKYAPSAVIHRHQPEGALVPAETPFFSYTVKMHEAVELETMLLQRVGMSCISAFNAYQMSRAFPSVPFLDMAARHCAPDDGTLEGMIGYCAYGASIGSKGAQMGGAKGFVGSSLDLTAPYYGAASGLGTMPHVLIGMAGSTVKAVELFIDNNPDDKFIVALVDYFGREYSDAIQCAEWFRDTQEGTGRTFAVRLDTHGGRFAEFLNYESSIEIVSDWLHVKGKWPVVEYVMGEEAFGIANDEIRDDVAKILFGTGVSAANIIQMRRKLDGPRLRAGTADKDVKIVASSGFDLFKCRIMAKAHAPIDLIGTGSFLPKTMNETYATCDAYAFNGKWSVKVGREHVFSEVAKQTLV